MFHCVAYSASAAAAGATNVDFTAATDTIFSVRNSHLIFSEQYKLYAAAMVGASVIRGRWLAPSWNAIGEVAIFAANRSLQPTSNPIYDLYDGVDIPIPVSEEIQFQVSNNLGAATEVETGVAVIATMDHNKNLPRGMLPFITRAQFTVTPAQGAWTGAQALTFSQTPRGGVYSVVGAECQGSNAAAFRLIFPRQKLVYGRAFRPGHLTQTAVGDVPNLQIRPYNTGWGEWGRFHTFEPVQCEVFGTAAAGTTYQLFLTLINLSTGNDYSPLDNWARGGM